MLKLKVWVVIASAKSQHLLSTERLCPSCVLPSLLFAFLPPHSLGSVAQSNIENGTQMMVAK